MSTLTVTARGQVTFSKEVLEHLRVKPCGKIELDLVPDGHALVRAAGPKGTCRELRGILKDKTSGSRLSIAQISEAISDAGAGSVHGKA